MKVLIVTGGHDFERERFFALFDAVSGAEWEEAQQPGANQLWVEGKIEAFDAVVLYDFWQHISEEQKDAFVHWVGRQGCGLVVLHHALANYQDWPEYPHLIGARADH